MKRLLFVSLAPIAIACVAPQPTTAPTTKAAAGSAGDCYHRAYASGDPDAAVAACDATHFARWRETCAGKGRTADVGCLDPRIIQAIVRRGFGEPKACYEEALVKSPDLRGRVETKFVIDEQGHVAHASNAGSTMNDAEIVPCVTRYFAKLRFPKPEGGNVTVVYPIDFNPGD